LKRSRGGRLARMHAAPATARWLAAAVTRGDGNPKQEWLRPQRFLGWG